MDKTSGPREYVEEKTLKYEVKKIISLCLFNTEKRFAQNMPLNGNGKIWAMPKNYLRTAATQETSSHGGEKSGDA